MTIRETAIPGLLVVELAVHGDARGWFKENWQREKMVAAGLPDLGPVQNNVSFNEEVGTTRGIHAEPWDKLVSVATGRVFGAWVDLRAGESFGRVVTVEIDPAVVVFVPRGVGNAYQTLERDTAYSYLVNDHWSPDAVYTFLNLDDPTAGIAWPIPLDRAVLSDKDRRHPRLADVEPIVPPRPLVLGANGQLGRALRDEFPDAVFLDRSAFDLADPDAVARVRWRDHPVVINAAAYTRVDEAESPSGRRDAWAANVEGVARLVRACRDAASTLVHVSTDYVFDGTEDVHDEDEPVSPLGVYGQTKAAGDALVATVPQHYVVRTSWVVGDGPNFVRTMMQLAARGVSPSVVDDQIGRLSFTTEIARAIRHLLAHRPPAGVYNVSSAGPEMSWADIARRVFDRCGRSGDDVTGVSTADYFRDRAAAPRPLRSTLTLDKIVATGFEPAEGPHLLDAYVTTASR